MLECKDVSVHYGKHQVLRDVCFRARPGRVTVVLGKNGSGKSTLLRCMNGLVKYTGQLLLAGEDLRALPPRERAKRMGFLPQWLPDTPMTAAQVCALGRSPYTGSMGSLTDKDRELVCAAMKTAGVAHLAERPCTQLSGGERQRVFLAMLLCQDALLLCLDEPASHLDADAARQLHGLIRQMAEAGKTVLCVMHDLSAALRLADDVVVLQDGGMAFCGTAAECAQSGIIEKVFAVQRHVCPDGAIFYT